MSELSIVVVDDDADTLEFMTECLTSYGYQVIPWSSSSGAIEQIQQQHPDLVVLDHRLDRPPNGWEIFLALRAEPTTAHIPVILYSAEPMVLQSYRDRLRSMGGDVLDKPFKMEALVAKIEALTNTVPQ
jgi:DNA-binding response OmpR family regulator